MIYLQEILSPAFYFEIKYNFLVALVAFKINDTWTCYISTTSLYSGLNMYNLAGTSLYLFQKIMTRSKYNLCIVLFTMKYFPNFSWFWWNEDDFKNQHHLIILFNMKCLPQQFSVMNTLTKVLNTQETYVAQK